MIKYVNGDIFKSAATVIVQSCNCFHTQGAGLALAIRKLYPEAYEADMKTHYGDKGKLGDISISDPSKRDGRVIINLYGQCGFGGGERNTSYDALADGFEKVYRYMAELPGHPVLGIPMWIGAGLGGGNPAIIKAIVESTFCDVGFEVLICKL